MKLQGSFIFFQHKTYRHYYCCHYLPLTSGIDTLSRSLLKFKRGAQPDRDSWLNRAVAGLGEILPTLPPDTIIIRALHHQETFPTGDRPSSLDLLGQTLSAKSRFPYIPALLQKHRPTPVNQGLSRAQRESELRDLYYLNPIALTTTAPTTPAEAGPSIPAATAAEAGTPTPAATANAPAPSSILLLDDILTTGATILSILKTLHAAWPNCPVTIFTLAKVL